MMRHIALLTLMALSLGGCAFLQQTDPLQVTMAGIEPLPGEGLELRMLVRLQVQNPNCAPIEYSGVYITLDVQDKTFATGVNGKLGRDSFGSLRFASQGEFMLPGSAPSAGR